MTTPPALYGSTWFETEPAGTVTLGDEEMQALTGGMVDACYAIDGLAAEHMRRVLEGLLGRAQEIEPRPAAGPISNNYSPAEVWHA